MKNSVSIFTVFAISAILAANRGSAAPTRLHYVTTAHQAGPVGFRDPIGTVSPDGVWLAYAVGSTLFVGRGNGIGSPSPQAKLLDAS